MTNNTNDRLLVIAIAAVALFGPVVAASVGNNSSTTQSTSDDAHYDAYCMEEGDISMPSVHALSDAELNALSANLREASAYSHAAGVALKTMTFNFVESAAIEKIYSKPF